MIFTVFLWGSNNLGDLDSSDIITATIQVTQGAGTLDAVNGTGATITNDGTRVVQISGTVAQVNAALDGLTYDSTQDHYGNKYTVLSISVTDSKSTTINSIDINVTPVDDNPTAGTMTATVNPSSKQTFDKFVPVFDDADNHDNDDTVTDNFAQLEIITLPTIGVFEMYKGDGDKSDDSNWITITNISALTKTSGLTQVDGRLVINPQDMPNYRFNSTLNLENGSVVEDTNDSNVGKATNVQWRIKTTGNLADVTQTSLGGWSNTATGTVSIQDFSANTKPNISIIYPNDGSLTDNTNEPEQTVTYDINGEVTTDNALANSSISTTNSNNIITISEDGQTASITLEYYDDIAPAAFIQGVMTSSNTDLIDFSDSSNYAMSVNIDSSYGTAGKGTITLTLKPKDNMYGTSTITFGANDGQKTTLETFILKVTPVNEKAIASDFTKQINEDNSFSFSTINPADIYQDVNDVNANKDVSDVNFDTQMSIIQNPASTDAQINSAIEALVAADYFPRSFVIDTLPTHGDLYDGNIKIETTNYVVDITKLSSLTYKPNQDYNINDGMDSFTWHAVDKDGMSTDTKTATFTVKAINDKPVISINVNESLVEDNTLTTSGTISVTDVDKPNKVSVSNEGVLASGVTNGLVNNDILKAMLSVNSSDIIDETVRTGNMSWSFNPGSETFDYLAKDEVLTLTYTIRATDTNDATSSNDDQKTATYDEKTITITITGTNDAPVIEVLDVSTDLTQDVKLTDKGSITFTDLDLTNKAKATEAIKEVNAKAQDGTTELVLTTTQKEAIENAFSITNIDTNTNNGEVTWDYEIAEANVDFLAVGEKVTAIFTITLDDDNGGVVTQDVTITITGTNDQPVIDSITQTGDLTEKDGTQSGTNQTNIKGTIELSDLDDTDTVKLSEEFNNDMVWSAGNITDNQLSAEQIQSLIDGFVLDDLGSNLEINDTTNKVNSSWTYTTEDNLNFLAVGETLTFSYTITATDDNSLSSSASATQDVTITITGTNDQPVIDSITQTGALTETDGTASGTNQTNIKGTIELSDLDDTDTVTLSEVFNNDMVWSAGTITDNQLTQTQIQSLIDGFVLDDLGSNLEIDDTTNKVNSSWTYTTTDNLNFLASGETLTFSYTVTATDDNSSASATKTVTITITGTNDTPTVVDTSNIDEVKGFGEAIQKETSYLFGDIDKNDVLTYKANNLPLGVKIDSKTGIITGNPVQPGVFQVEIIATDNNGQSAKRTYELIVTAPAKAAVVDAPQKPSEDKNSGNDGLTDKNQDLKQGNGLANDIGISDNTEASADVIGNNLQGIEQRSNDDVNLLNSELTSTTTSTGKNVTDRMIQADVGLSIQSDGKIGYSNKDKEAFQVVGLNIESIEYKSNYIEIKIIDSKVGQKYSATLLNGDPLPNSLNFDPNTGVVKGVMPEGIKQLDVSIRALSSDGTTRVLNMKIDVNELNQLMEQNEQNIDEEKFQTLNEQLQLQNHELNDYGTYIVSLFNKTA